MAFGLLGPATGTVKLSETFDSLVILRVLGLGTEGVCVTTLKLPPESISFEVLGAGLVVGPTFAAIRVDLLRSIVGSSRTTTTCCFFRLRRVRLSIDFVNCNTLELNTLNKTSRLHTYTIHHATPLTLFVGVVQNRLAFILEDKICCKT